MSKRQLTDNTGCESGHARSATASKFLWRGVIGIAIAFMVFVVTVSVALVQLHNRYTSESDAIMNLPVTEREVRRERMTGVLAEATEIIGHARWLETVTGLIIRSKEIDEEEVQSIANLSNLESLTLNGSMWPDGQLSQLEQLRNLEYVSVAFCSITLKDLNAFVQMRSLRELHLSGVRLDTSGFEPLSNLDGLRKLNLSSVDIGDDDIKHIANIRTLRILDL